VPGRIHLQTTVPERHVVAGDQAMLISLTRIAKGTTYTKLASNCYFGGSVVRWHGAFKDFITHMYETFFHKISGMSLEDWTLKGHIDSFRQILHSKLARTPTYVDIAAHEALGYQHITCVEVTLESFQPRSLLDQKTHTVIYF
jgi:hypothetical protein